MGDIDSKDLEESFSFSCYELDYPFGIFSDDDTDDDDEDVDDNESYIEIALDSKRKEPLEEFEFCISFSSNDICSQSPSHKLFECSSPSVISTSDHKSSSESKYVPETSSTTDVSVPRIHKQKRFKFLSIIRRLFNDNMSSGLKSSDTAEENDRRPAELIVKAKNPEVHSRRKASKMSRAINGGIIKLFIKFRPERIRSTLVSLLKPYQFSNKMTEESTGKHRKLMNPFHKWLVNSDNNNKNKYEKSSRELAINVDDIRGVLEAVNLTIGHKGEGTQSCPSSIKSSPICKGTTFYQNRSFIIRESSINAAIAHCKRS